MIASSPTIDQLVNQIQEKKLPPVHLWHPENTGEIDIRISRNGKWYYEGSLIHRPAMVRLFSKVLRRDGDQFFLVTPVEMLRITVEDTPFIAVSMEVVVEEAAQFLIFTTNVGDQVIAGSRHQLFVHYNSRTGEPSPYIEVRSRLNARLTRPVFYQLADYCAEQDDHYVVASDDCSFKLGSL